MKRAKVMADYIWDKLSKEYPSESDTGNLYMFLDHWIAEALQDSEKKEEEEGNPPSDVGTCEANLLRVIDRDPYGGEERLYRLRW